MSEVQLIVFPAKDLDGEKQLFTSLLGTEPYVDTAYYIGFRADGTEIGLDPNGASNGPIAYWDVDDLSARLADLSTVGWEVVSGPHDVGGGLLVAQLRDGNGSTIGLRQSPR